MCPQVSLSLYDPRGFHVFLRTKNMEQQVYKLLKRILFHRPYLCEHCVGHMQKSAEYK